MQEIKFSKLFEHASELSGFNDTFYQIYDKTILIDCEEKNREGFTCFDGLFKFINCKIILNNSICGNGLMHFINCNLIIENDLKIRAENGVILFDKSQINNNLITKNSAKFEELGGSGRIIYF